MTTTRGATMTDNMGRAYAHAGRCRCVHCGWLVPAEGVSIMPEYDVAADETAPERCSDSACVSRAVCDMRGVEVES